MLDTLVHKIQRTERLLLCSTIAANDIITYRYCKRASRPNPLVIQIEEYVGTHATDGRL